MRESAREDQGLNHKASCLDEGKRNPGGRAGRASLRIPLRAIRVTGLALIRYSELTDPLYRSTRCHNSFTMTGHPQINGARRCRSVSSIRTPVCRSSFHNE